MHHQFIAKILITVAFSQRSFMTDVLQLFTRGFGTVDYLCPVSGYLAINAEGIWRISLGVKYSKERDLAPCLTVSWFKVVPNRKVLPDTCFDYGTQLTKWTTVLTTLSVKAEDSIIVFAASATRTKNSESDRVGLVD